MRLLLFIGGVCVCSTLSFSQSATLEVQVPKLSASYHFTSYSNFSKVLESPRTGLGQGISFEYDLKNRWSVATHFLHGKYTSTNPLSLGPSAPSYQGLDAIDHTALHFSLVAFKNFPLGTDINLKTGFGVGLYYEIEEYYYLRGNEDLYYMDTIIEVIKDPGFPLLVELTYTPLPHVVLGVTGGTFFTPFYSVFGWHVGPKIGYKF
jgi:hypothetical protein